MPTLYAVAYLNAAGQIVDGVVLSHPDATINRLLASRGVRRTSVLHSQAFDGSFEDAFFQYVDALHRSPALRQLLGMPTLRSQVKAYATGLRPGDAVATSGAELVYGPPPSLDWANASAAYGPPAYDRSPSPVPAYAPPPASGAGIAPSPFGEAPGMPHPDLPPYVEYRGLGWPPTPGTLKRQITRFGLILRHGLSDPRVKRLLASFRPGDELWEYDDMGFAGALSGARGCYVLRGGVVVADVTWVVS